MRSHRKSTRRDRRARRRLIAAVLLFLALLAVAFLLLFSSWLAKLLRRATYASRSSTRCRASKDPLIAMAPNYMFVSLVNATTAHLSLVALSKLNIASSTCVHRMYVAAERDFSTLSLYHGSCSALGNGCAVEIHLHNDAHMWGDLSLRDVANSTKIIFLRDGAAFTDRALAWIKLAHEATQRLYADGGRHDIGGAAIGCHGEGGYTPWWSMSVGSLNTTCAFSPIRAYGPNVWEFFSHWFASRRREWVSWPHTWDRLNSVPEFWKGTNKNSRDRRLIEFGEVVGKDYSYVNNPYLSWERWFPRWASNYTLRVLTAESNLGVTLPDLREPTAAPLRPTRNDSTLGIYSTSYGDVLSVGRVWYEPVDGDLGSGYFNALKKIVSHKPKMVSLTIVNHKFMQLTRSWLCNVEGGGFAPPNIIWITLDERSKAQVKELGIGHTIDILDALSADNMDSQNIIYGQPAYWRLMLMRTRLIRDLLDRGIDVFLFETDQVWLQNPFDYIRKELEAGSDMVGTLDTQHNVAGNTIMLRSILPTRRMWSEVYTRFKADYDFKNVEKMKRHESTFVKHDQHHLSDLLLFNPSFIRDFPVALGLLNAELFVGGSWYFGKYKTVESRRPVIINNNFISGTEKKKARAISFGHWFLQSDNKTCDMDTVHEALRYKFKSYPY
ncbi:glycosyl transferase family GT77 cell wall biosynthesis [Gracilaria domingensis]|nr:glycosyl transferase family GT77 cell wall biosynthesis [Gracilaria domingensis]